MDFAVPVSKFADTDLLFVSTAKTTYKFRVCKVS